MAHRPMNVPNASPPRPQIFRISRFSGINISDTPTEIKDNESPDLRNIQMSPIGAIERRPGYSRIYSTSLGAGAINGLFEYNNSNLLIAHTDKIYTQTGSAQPLLLYSGKANARTNFFQMNNIAYILDGTNYLQYNGTTVADVLASAYVPTITINTLPDGSNYDPNEEFNLLSPGFIQKFSSNGTATTYQLFYTILDLTTITVIYNNTTYTEGVSFSVNRTLGTIDFTGGTTPLGAPTAGTNNVEIKAYKTFAGESDKIKKCRFATLYGGQNDTRVFLAGNTGFKNTLFYSEVYRADYFPINNFINIGATYDEIMGFSLQYDSLVIHKRFSKWNLRIEFDSLGIAFFPVKPINDTIGCISENSIQVIENNPIALTEKGIYILSGGQVRDERNAKLVSQNIDGLLFGEDAPEDSISVDFNQKYWLVFPNYSNPSRSKAYIWDYIDNFWYVWDDMKFSCFLLRSNGRLLMGDLSNGIVYQNKTTSDTFAYNDDGAAYTSYWKSKILSFGSNYMRKLVESVFFSLKAGSPSSADLYYYTEDYSSGIVSSTYIDSFSYNTINYAEWTYMASSFPQEIREKIREKKIIYFQLEFKNDRKDESMTILNIDIKFLMQQEVK